MIIDISIKRAKEILKKAIIAYEFELGQQDYDTEEEMHRVLLNEFGMTQDEFETIAGRRI